jgi:hypothetical protein
VIHVTCWPLFLPWILSLHTPPPQADPSGISVESPRPLWADPGAGGYLQHFTSPYPLVSGYHLRGGWSDETLRNQDGDSV